MTRVRHSVNADSCRRCARVVRIVAAHRNLERSELLSPSRSRSSVAAARQLAMYLCHVMLGLNLTEVGAYFGRDRTTVAHACALVEDSREDLKVDAEIQRLEDLISDDIGDKTKTLLEGLADAVA